MEIRAIIRVKMQDVSDWIWHAKHERQLVSMTLKCGATLDFYPWASVEVSEESGTAAIAFWPDTGD